MNQTSLDASKAKTFSGSDSLKPGKYEVLDGKLVAKAAASRRHNIICTNLVGSLSSRVQRSSTEVYACDIRVRLSRDSICFPDVLVVNGVGEFATEDSGEVLVNPALIIEIFSSFSKSSSRAQKLEGFLAIPKLKECLLVSEDEMRVEHYAWQNPKQWIYRIYNEREDVIALDSINCKLSVSEVYSQVTLREAELKSRAVN